MNRPLRQGFFFKSRVQGRLFFSLLAIGLLPLLLTAHIGYEFASNALEDEGAAQLRHTAQMKSKMLNSWYQERLHDIGDIAESEHLLHCPELNPSDNESQTCFLLERFKKHSAIYRHLLIIDKELKTVAATRPLPDEIDRDRIMSLVSDSLAASGKAINRLYRNSSQDNVLALAQKVMVDRETTYIIVALLDMTVISQHLMESRREPGNNGIAYLVDAQGKPLNYQRFANDKARNFTIDVAPETTRQMQHIRNNPEKNVLRYTLHLPEFDWYLVAERDADEVFRPIRFIRTIVLGSTLFLILVVAILSDLVAHSYTKPLREAAKKAEAVSRGDLSAKIDYHSTGEIQNLIDAFNKMVEHVRLSQEELAQKQSELQHAYNKLINTQDRLLQQERMAAIGQFTASVIHEMRNPLSTIQMNLQILARPAVDPHRLKQHYSLAFSAVSRLQTMFNDLLNFAKPIDIKPKSTKIRPVIAGALLDLEKQIEERRITSQMDIQLGDEHIMLDPARFRQVFVNLFSNAIDAMPAGGTILVRCQFVEDRLHIDVIDDGSGMTPEVSRRLFEPFFTTKEKGVGLGLLVVKKIVEAHGGSVAVDSSNGAGTTVRITL